MTGDYFNKPPPQFFPIVSNTPHIWVLGVLVIAVAFVIILTKQGAWSRFAFNHKWLSRIALMVIAVFIVMPVESAAPILWSMLPGKIDMESPNLTIIAIKLGIANLYTQREIANELPEKKAVIDCIAAISMQKASEWQVKCGKEDTACMENIPPTTRANLIDAIKDTQSATPSDIFMTYTLVRAPCKAVDVSKL